MDASLFEKIGPIADKLTTIAFALGALVFVAVAGYRGWFVFGSVVKARLAEKDAIIKDKDHEIEKREAKLYAQERLIDRLSGVAERSTELARPMVVHELQEHRARVRSSSRE